MKIKFPASLSAALILLAAAATPSLACDICGSYLTNDAHAAGKTGWFVATSVQYTRFNTLQEDGHEVGNPTDQHLDSVIQQTVLGYSFTDRLGAQVNVPLIYRSYSRPEGFEKDSGTESGFGDISLLGRLQLVRKDTEAVTFVWNVMAGVKAPTGNSRRIAEELEEIEVEGAPESGIHGHDLTLGSGSWDGLTGTDIYVRAGRAFLTASAQYAIRGKGDYDYRFANDLTWEAAPGCYLIFNKDHTLALQAALSGESKDTDTFQGHSAGDTGLHAVYLGPKISTTWTDHLSAELGMDFPIHLQNTELQAVPDYRLRAGVTWRF